MKDESNPDERTRRLIAEFIDGELSATDISELNQLLQSDPKQTEQVVEQLILDSLLTEELGAESLTALVDLVSNDQMSDVASQSAKPFTSILRYPSGTRRFWQSLGGVAIVASVVVAFAMGRWENSALANAATVVKAAIETHSEPIERVYMVQTERATGDTGLNAPRDVRVATQGDRFYVEMNRGERRWYWGLDADGAIWLTLGPRRAIVVDQEECGVPLQYISNLYTLNLESLLQNFLKRCTLTHEVGPGTIHSITAIPRRRWHAGVLRKAIIEVDRETKAVRRLVIEREIPRHGRSTVTFTLVDSRIPDESKYRPEGHLVEPFRLLTRETQPDRRRELMTNWFGPVAERWIVSVPEADAIQNLTTESEHALRSRVTELFESLRSGKIENCLKLTDSQVVREKGRSQVLSFFRSVSGLVRTSGIQSQDRVITGVSLIENGQAARVDIQVTLNGVVQPPGFEIWRLMNGQWFYRETPK